MMDFTKFKKIMITVTVVVAVIVLIIKPPFVIMGKYYSLSLSNFYCTYSKRIRVNLRDGEEKKLRHFKYLKFLHVQNADDLSFLYEMKDLEELHLQNGSIMITANPTDFTPLFELDNLKIFWGASLKHLTDLSGFLEMKKLKELALWSIEIDKTNMAIIGEMVQLERLDLFFVETEDFTPLKNLVNLKILYLQGTNISDLSVISDMQNLETLNLQETELTDFSPILALPALKELYVDEGDLSDEQLIQFRSKGVNVVVQN